MAPCVSPTCLDFATFSATSVQLDRTRFFTVPFHHNHNLNMTSWAERFEQDEKLASWFKKASPLEPGFYNGLRFFAMAASGRLVESDFVEVSVSISPSA